MEEVWNSWDLKAPPICRIKMPLRQKEILPLRKSLFTITATLKNLEILHTEAAILSRFLYKCKRTFRHDKGFQNLVKIKQSLRRYLKLNLMEEISKLKDCLPSKISPGATHIYLPTRQMLKYVLLRLQAFSKLFLRLMKLTKEAGKYLFWRLALGWSSGYVLFGLTLAARIFAISNFCVSKSIEWYNLLYSHLPRLPETAEYLPDANLPEDLKTWLGWAEPSEPSVKTSIDRIFELVDLVEDDEIKFTNEIVVIKELKKFEKLDVNDADSPKIIDISTEIKGEPHHKSSKQRKRKVNALPPCFTIEDEGTPVDVVDPISSKKFKKSKKKRHLNPLAVR